MRQLVELADRLYVLGIAQERARIHLKNLVQAEAPRDTLISAALQYQYLQAQWYALEKEYFHLREQVNEQNAASRRVEKRNKKKD